MDPVKAAEYYATVFSNLRKIVRDREENGGKGFSHAFALLRTVNENGTCVESTNEENAARNRYRNVLAFDATRVILRDMRDGNDYINANWIAGYDEKGSEKEQAYIATQGPVPESMSDFWHMIFQEKVRCGQEQSSFRSYSHLLSLTHKLARAHTTPHRRRSR